MPGLVEQHGISKRVLLTAVAIPAFSSAAEASLAQFATLGAYSLKPGARDPSVTSNRASNYFALPNETHRAPWRSPAPTFEKDVLAETPSSAAPAAGRRRRTRPVPGSLPAVTPVPPARPRPKAAAEDVDEPPRQKKPCFGGASVETLADVESRFLGATLPLQ